MSREAAIERTTAETSIRLRLDLDGSGVYDIATGIGFFDHMLSHIARHGRFDLTIAATGDLHVDDHHTVEDVGICLGKAIADALAEKRGIERFGTAFVTMDEALARTLELVNEFFRAVAAEGKMNLHIALLYGANAHHQVEAIFKSFGRALRAAVEKTGGDEIPSTKGVL